LGKYFSKGRLKKEEVLVLMNLLLAYDEEIDKIIRDAKCSLDRYKIRIGV